MQRRNTRCGCDHSRLDQSADPMHKDRNHQRRMLPHESFSKSESMRWQRTLKSQPASRPERLRMPCRRLACWIKRSIQHQRLRLQEQATLQCAIAPRKTTRLRWRAASAVPKGSQPLQERGWVWQDRVAETLVFIVEWGVSEHPSERCGTLWAF